MDDQALRLRSSVGCKNGRDLGQSPLIRGTHVAGSVGGRLHLLLQLDLPPPGRHSLRLQLFHERSQAGNCAA